MDPAKNPMAPMADRASSSGVFWPARRPSGMMGWVVWWAASWSWLQAGKKRCFLGAPWAWDFLPRCSNESSGFYFPWEGRILAGGSGCSLCRDEAAQTRSSTFFCDFAKFCSKKWAHKREPTFTFARSLIHPNGVVPDLLEHLLGIGLGGRIFGEKLVSVVAKLLVFCTFFSPFRQRLFRCRACSEGLARRCCEAGEWRGSSSTCSTGQRAPAAPATACMPSMTRTPRQAQQGPSGRLAKLHHG